MYAEAIPFPWKEADEMLTLLIERALALGNCAAGSIEEIEFDRLASAMRPMRPCGGRHAPVEGSGAAARRQPKHQHRKTRSQLACARPGQVHSASV